jgi:hypothetical protein
MTKDEALDLVDQYCSLVKELGGHNEIVTGLRSRFPEDGSEKKAMRWLGFMQGVLYITEIFTLEELKIHSRDKVVSGPVEVPEEVTTEIEWFGDSD